MSTRAGARRRSRPGFDRLEDRQLLATLDITAAGALTYTATSGTASNLAVATNGSAYTFSDTSTQGITLSGAGDTGWTTTTVGSTIVATGPNSSVTSIAISQAGGVTNTFGLTSVDAPTTVNFANSSTNTLDIAATGVAATAPVTVTASASAALTLGINAGMTAGTFQTGAAGSIVDVAYQASGSGLISVATADEPSFVGPNFTNVAAGSLAVDLNSLYTSPTALGTFIDAGGSNTYFTLSENSYAIPTADLGAITVDGTTSGQALTVYYGFGDPLPASGLTYSPAAATSPNSNSLRLASGSFTSESYTATGAGAGSITYNGSKTITFSNLSPIFDTVPSPTFTFTAPSGGGQTVDLVNGPVISGTQTAQINDGGTGHFELVDFGNKGAVTLITPGTGNTALVNYSLAPAGMTSLAVNGPAGDSATTNVDAAPGAVPTAVTTSGGGTTTIGAVGPGGLPAVQSNVSVNDLTGGATLNVNDAGDATGQTYTLGGSTITTTATPAVFSYASSVGTVNLTGGSGTNTFNTNETALVPADTYLVTGGSGFNTLNVTTTSRNVDASTPGILRFGAGYASINYASIQQINITKPTASPVGTGIPFTAVEAAQFTADRVATFTTTDLGTAADFVASINWGDGSTSSGGAILANGTTSYDVTGGHSYAAAGIYSPTITLTALGGAGTETVGSTNITITSVGREAATPTPISTTATVVAAPLHAHGASVSGTQYLPLAVSGGVLVATFTDSGTILPPSGYTASIDWGDGSTSAATSITSQGTPNGVVYSVFGNHTYTTPGSEPISVTITKTESGATTVANSTAIIAPDAALASTGVPIAGTQFLALSSANGGNPVLVATFTDSSAILPVADYSATIAWGDGTTSAASSITEQGGTNGVVFSVFGNHTYTAPGSYPVSVTITKAPLPGSSQPTTPLPTTVASSTATIAPDSSLVSQGVPIVGTQYLSLSSANAGNPVLVATFTDSSETLPVTGYSASIAWGDGTTSAASSITEQGTSSGIVFSVFGDHTYTSPGSYPVYVTITKAPAPGSTQPGPGSVTIATSTATIAPDAALLSQGAPVSGIEGLPLSTTNGGNPVLVATFTDSSAIQPVTGYSAMINWGDGSAPTAASSITEQGTSSGVVFSVFGDHTYAIPGSYPITVTILKAPLPNSTQPAPGATTVASSAAVIADAPLAAATPQPTISTTEGAPFNGPVATFTDLNPAAAVGQFHATIDWGDGLPNSVGTVTFANAVFTVSGSHQYLQSAPQGTYGPVPTSGTFPVKVSILDIYGSKLNLTNTATVADQTLTVSGGLDPASNSSGIAVTPITNVVQPTFIGAASEPYAKITIFAVQVNPSGPGTLVPVGQGQANVSGSWAVTTSTALTNGFYDFYARGVDQTGQTYSALAFLGGATIDTLGPKITGLDFQRVQGQISYTIQDFGAVGNMGSGVVIASLMDANNYAFTKAHVGRKDAYKITSITVSPGTDFGPQTVTLTINHGHYLRGGRYYITIKSLTDANTSGIRDLAGNALDGEFYNYFPSGNNVNGGNFAAELNAIHHIIYEPVSTVGTATPVNPPGTLGANTTIPTYNPPPKHARVLGALLVHDKALHHLRG